MNQITIPILIAMALAVVSLLLTGEKGKFSKWLPLLGLVPVGLILFPVLQSGGHWSCRWVPPFSLDFSVTPWKTFLIGFVFFFQLMACLYWAFQDKRVAKPNLLGAGMLIALGSTLGVLLTNNVFVILIFWEMFLLALYLSILSGGKEAEPAARKALIIGGASDFLMILGLMMFQYMSTTVKVGGPFSVDSPMGFWSFFLIFLGAGAKAGMFPFHTWIPDAAVTMPTQGFAALPASLEKILGIYFLYIVSNQMFVLNGFAKNVMLTFGLCTVFVSIVPAFVAKDLKKVLALTAISPVGFMVCGLAVNASIAAAGALMYMLTHAMYKSAMFYVAGIYENAAGSTEFSKLQGIGKKTPLATASFILAAFAAVSLPWTGGFYAKECILEGLLEKREVGILAALVLGAILNTAVFCKVIHVLSTRRSEPACDAAPSGMALVPVVLTGIGAIVIATVFQVFNGLIGNVLGLEFPWMPSVGHFTVLSLVSLMIWVAGFVIYARSQQDCASPAQVYDNLMTSPMLGPALTLAEAKRFDAYEVGVTSVQFIARVVFLYVERMVDTVGTGIIAGVRWITRPSFSGVHNGVYANYLGWVIAGCVIILSLLMSGVHH